MRLRTCRVLSVELAKYLAATSVCCKANTWLEPHSGLKLESYSLGALPLRDLSHNQQTIAEMWLRVCAETFSIDSDRFQPVITTDGAANMVAAGRCADG